MKFVNFPGLKGKVFVPEDSSDSPRKNSCKGCFSCQMCSEDRCSICMNIDPEISCPICEKVKSDEERERDRL